MTAPYSGACACRAVRFALVAEPWQHVDPDIPHFEKAYTG